VPPKLHCRIHDDDGIEVMANRRAPRRRAMKAAKKMAKKT
jgi:hypothetical protein